MRAPRPVVPSPTAGVALPPSGGNATPAVCCPHSDWWRRGAVIVVLAVLGLVACRWRPDTGFTALIRFGETIATQQLPEVRRLNVALAPNAGYDGQFYAQLAVEPNLQRPELAQAVPGLGYRARRILLPWLAHVLGLGRPEWILQVYALLNVAAWLAFAWLWARECPPDNAAGFARWASGVLALGTLDSVRMALTDLPATLLIVLGVRALAAARPWLAAACLALGGLVRETGLLAAFLVSPHQPDARQRFAWLRCALVLAPALGWSAWLLTALPAEPSNIGGNFDWPGFAFARHLWHCAAAIAQGNMDTRFTFGLLGGLGFAAQTIFLFRRWHCRDPWVQMALPFAVLFWFLGDHVWHGYWAIARVVLPMTLGFVRIAPIGWSFAFLNLTVLHAIYRFMP